MADTKNGSIKPVLVRSATVACVVGPTLTVINQFEAVFGPSNVDFVALALTMCVPFCVSTYSGLLSRRQFLHRLNILEVEHAEALAEQERDFEIKNVSLQEDHAAELRKAKSAEGTT